MNLYHGNLLAHPSEPLWINYRVEAQHILISITLGRMATTFTTVVCLNYHWQTSIQNYFQFAAYHLSLISFELRIVTNLNKLLAICYLTSQLLKVSISNSAISFPLFFSFPKSSKYSELSWVSWLTPWRMPFFWTTK